MPLDPFKFVVHIAKAKAGLPIRGGLARAAAWAYLFKIYILKDWVNFCEVYGQPLRVGKYNAGATEEDKRALLQAVANIGTDSAAIIPESMLIEFVEAKSVTQNGELYHRACEYIDDSLSKVVLGQTLTTQMPRQGGGSRAAAQVHDAVRRDILAYDARKLSLTLTNQLIKPMVDLTFGPQDAYPQFWLSMPADQDVKTQSEVIADLADHGLEIGQDYVRDVFGIPTPAPGEVVLKPKTSLSGNAGQNANRGIGPYQKTYSSRPLIRELNRSLIRTPQMGEPLAIPEDEKEIEQAWDRLRRLSKRL
jgi:phage gp29-like protein